jgi:lipoprotein-releasing system permease protein
MVGSLALVVILSVFNGLEDLVVSRFNAFDPEIKITNVDGKNFTSDIILNKLNSNKDIKFASYSLTENILIKYRDKHHPFKVKGVDENFMNITGIDTMMLRGMFKLSQGDLSTAVIGYSVEYYLSVNIFLSESMKLYLPKQKGTVSNLNPESAFYKSNINAVGVYGVDKEVDDYIILPLKYLQKIGKYDNKIDAVDIKLIDENKVDKVKSDLQKILGKEYKVQDRFEQHAVIYKIMRSEKAIVFIILSFILLIASFNIVGSITMLILDKNSDIKILQSIGGNVKKLREIFFTEGIIITQVGLLLGILLGIFVVYLQEKFGLITLGGNDLSSFIVNAYPVKLIYSDLIYVYITVSLIGFVATIIPVRFAFKKLMKDFNI